MKKKLENDKNLASLFKNYRILNRKKRSKCFKEEYTNEVQEESSTFLAVDNVNFSREDDE